MLFYTISEFAEKINITPHTLRQWDKEGTFKPHHKTQGGHRYYSQEQLDNYIKIKNNLNTNRIVVGYCRVSSKKQIDDLERQINSVKTYMIAKGYQFEIITDIGSGINYNKDGLQSLLDRVVKYEVDKIVVLYKDRLLRIGFELFESICKRYNTTIEIIDNSEKTEQQELVEDLIQIITVFSCKLEGKRSKTTKQLIESLKNDKSL